VKALDLSQFEVREANTVLELRAKVDYPSGSHFQSPPKSDFSALKLVRAGVATRFRQYTVFDRPGVAWTAAARAESKAHCGPRNDPECAWRKEEIFCSAVGKKNIGPQTEGSTQTRLAVTR